MATRASQLFMPTLREDPAEAEAISHKLLLRGGFVRQVGAGLYTFLPLGWRVSRRSMDNIRSGDSEAKIDVRPYSERAHGLGYDGTQTSTQGIDQIAVSKAT